MVSFQTPFPQLDDQRKMISETDDERNSKNMKRKWNDSQVDEVILPFKHWRNPKANMSTATTTTTTTTTKSSSDIELHLETPLPSEWQRCLDIQSGEIHFYNTRTQKRTLKDPRESSSDPPNPRDCHMSLDLELNLPCGSLNHNSPKSTPQKNSPPLKKKSNSPPPPMRASMDLFKSLSTVGNKNDTAVEEADESTEMVATACKRCHMLVMLCKSSPTCPNCKYVHPPCQSTLDLFKPRLSLSY